MSSKMSVFNDVLFLKCSYYFFKTCGLATMSLNLQTVTDNRKTKANLMFLPSYRGMIYNALLIIALILLNCVILPFSYTGGSPDRLKFDRIADLSRLIVALVVSLFVLLFFSFRVKDIIRLTDDCKILDQLIATNCCYDDKNSIKSQTSLGAIKKSFLVSGLVWIILIVTTPLPFDELLAYYILEYSSDMVVNCMFLQYSFVLRLIRQLFKVVNDKFSNISSSHEQQQEATIIRYQGEIVSPKYSNDFITETAISKLAHLREIHASLCDFVERVVDFYSYPTLFCISYTFVALIIYAYYIFKGIISDDKSFDELSYVHNFFQMVIYILPVISLTRSVSEIIHESKRTGKIVNKLMAKTQNHLITMKLNQFSNYLLHQNLQFSVADLFSLDGSLIMSIIGSITTYMVILLQFQEKNL